MVTFHLITSQDLAPVVSSVLVKVLPALATQLKVHSSTTLHSRIKSFLPDLHGLLFAIERRSFGDLRVGSCWHVLCAPYLKHGRRMLADSCFIGWGVHVWAGLGYRISPGSCRLNQLSQELWSAERPCKSL